jgi:hypothetical protein
MTAASPPDQDERPLQMANNRLVVAGVVAGIWLGLAVLLWLVLRTDRTGASGALLAISIVALAASTAHAVIALHGWRRLGVLRWPGMALLILVCSWLSHGILAKLGMAQSLTQDIVNMTVVSGIALACSQAWSGERARRSLAIEAARRARAEARLAQGRLRPSGLVAVKVGHGERMVDPATISRVEADGNFTILHECSGPIFVSESMKTVIERLEPYGFVRVHKSHAVNAEAVQERRRDAVVLRDGVTVVIGRAYRV